MTGDEDDYITVSAEPQGRQPSAMEELTKVLGLMSQQLQRIEQTQREFVGELTLQRQAISAMLEGQITVEEQQPEPNRYGR